jgi:hypothetical protein
VLDATGSHYRQQQAVTGSYTGAAITRAYGSHCQPRGHPRAPNGGHWQPLPPAAGSHWQLLVQPLPEPPAATVSHADTHGHPMVSTGSHYPQPLAATGNLWQQLAATGSHYRQQQAVTGSHWQPLATTGSHWQPLSQANRSHWQHWHPLLATGFALARTGIHYHHRMGASCCWQRPSDLPQPSVTSPGARRRRRHGSGGGGVCRRGSVSAGGRVLHHLHCRYAIRSSIGTGLDSSWCQLVGRYAGRYPAWTIHSNSARRHVPDYYNCRGSPQ